MGGALLGVSLAALLAGSAAAWACARSPRLATAAAVAATVLGGACAVAAAVPVLLGGEDVALRLPLRLASEPVSLGVDPLSALFLALIGFLAVPTAVFGAGYLSGGGAHGGRGTTPAAARAHAGLAALVASMVLVVTARSALVFLVAWEAMTVAAYLLVVFDHESADVRRAGLVYFVASHVASACLFAFFAVLGARAGSLSFAAMATAGAAASAPVAAGLFALAVFGFGTKAGLVPLHTWLPRAHPAAPSHVSALMSGALIKTGVYGILRTLALLGPPRAGFGIALLVLGAASAVYGIAFAVGQRDLKRALAYSSVENVGLIVLGIGLSQLAAALGDAATARLAAAGALVHAVHHMLMKGGLFLGAGAVVHATGTRDVEAHGGLLRRMPRTGAAFLTNAAAIAALPPFCGFVGEWLLLVAAVRLAACPDPGAAVGASMAVLAIVLAGGLAAAALARLGAVVFLGTPRSPAAECAREGGPLLVGPVVALAACCVVPGLVPQLTVGLVERAAAGVAGASGAAVGAAVGAATLDAIADVGRCGALLVVVVAALVVVRRAAGRRGAADVATWGCGYAGRPGTRFQYTASSFGAPLVRSLSGLLAPRAPGRPAAATFAAPPTSELRIPDRVEQGLVEPLFRGAAQRMAVVRRFQDGRVTRYLMFLVAALVTGLGWAVAARWVLP